MRGLGALALLLAVSDLGSGCRGGESARLPAPEPLGGILTRDPELAEWTRSAEEHRLQIVLGWLEEDGSGRSVLRQSAYRAGAEYFYPASSIKLFAAIAALERLAELAGETGLELGPDTPLVYHPLFDGESLEEADPSHLAGGTITARHEIRKLFLVSDNEAFNRLYELTGQDGLAASLERAGLGGARLVHRLEEARSPEENRQAPRIDLVGAGFTHTLPERTAPPLVAAPAVAGLRVGRAFLAGGERVEEPMDFAGKNRMSLVDLQRGLCKLVRPDADCGPGGAFRLRPVDRAFVVDLMARFPRESGDPVYDPAEYPDAWGKFLLPGITRVVPAERVRIHNKIGRAYGFSTENAWIVDAGSGRGFFLAATIYTNRDGVLNDDRYEYETEAAGFFTHLGEAAAEWFWGAPGAQPKNR